MAVIIKLALAKADLIEIWDYIAEDSEIRADAYINIVDQKFLLLSRQPNLGRPRYELAKNMRSFPLGRYVIFYIVLPNGIQIVRVLHGARDLAAIFEADV